MIINSCRFVFGECLNMLTADCRLKTMRCFWTFEVDT